MRQQVIFRNRQETQAGDFNNLQDYVKETFDDLVRDAIVSGRAFAGFTVSEKSATELSVAPGRLVSDGAIHLRQDEVPLSVFDYLPVAAKRIVTVIAWGSTNQTDVQPRDFLVNIETGVTEPQAVAMQRSLYANINLLPGIESADPQPAPIEASYLAIAHVRLGVTGIEEINMVEANRLPQVAAVAGRVSGLESWRGQVEPRIATIASDISALAAKMRLAAAGNFLLDVAGDVARLKEVNGLPDDYAQYGADHFLDTDETDTTNPEYLAKTEEGIRFAPEAMGDGQLSVFNPLDQKSKVDNGVLLPAFDLVPRLQVLEYGGEVSIAQYQYQTFEMVERMMSRQRIRYGAEFKICTNHNWWKSGKYDSVTNTFKVGTEVFTVLNPQDRNGKHNTMRLQQIFVDTFEEPYWDALTVNHTVNGSQCWQSFLNSQDGWCKGVGLFFPKLAGSGNVHVALCELTQSGTPDREKAIATVTIDRGSLKLFPAETFIEIPATFLQAGKRYAWLITTGGNHFVAVATGGAYVQGTFGYTTDGAYYDGDLTKDLMMKVYFAQFRQSRVVVELNPLSLSGGIAAIDVIAGLVAPKSTAITFEVQVAGVWRPLSEVDTTALVGLPPLLPFRVAFVGTTDIMGGVQISGSRVRVSRPRTIFKHFSTLRTLAAPTSEVRLDLLLQGWDPAKHTLTPTLKIGSTIEAPDVTETMPADPSDPTMVMKRLTFNLAAPTSSYVIVIGGTTTTALDVFLVNERVDIAF
ncbi:hypothetical protein [Kaistia granuli]|uniref:hypothetical protein n=1 Tax=Kaistia granuli TaxID=363259 RepID=UPI000362204C|nr:hypothetical protein [Kaistia granuli]